MTYFYEYKEDYYCFDCLLTILLQQENAELKKQLHDASIQIQEMIEQDLECPSNCSKIEELKKQYEKSINDYCRLDARNRTQQKEFVKYLEDEQNKWHYNYDSYNYEYEVEEPTAEDLLTTILSKYKEIIGDGEDD